MARKIKWSDLAVHRSDGFLACQIGRLSCTLSTSIVPISPHGCCQKIHYKLWWALFDITGVAFYMQCPKLKLKISLDSVFSLFFSLHYILHETVFSGHLYFPASNKRSSTVMNEKYLMYCRKSRGQWFVKCSTLRSYSIITAPKVFVLFKTKQEGDILLLNKVQYSGNMVQ